MLPLKIMPPNLVAPFWRSAFTLLENLHPAVLGPELLNHECQCRIMISNAKMMVGALFQVSAFALQHSQMPYEVIQNTK